MCRKFVADFETTTKIEDCRVWAFALCEVGNDDNIIVGTTIDEFMDWCQFNGENVEIYFHNLKFDSQFIMSWLFKNGFKHTDRVGRATNTFQTLITEQGLYYKIEVIFYLKGKKVNKVTFIDSLKKIPLSVDAIAKALNLPFKKLEIDYDGHNDLPVGAPLTKEEKEYIINDVKIVAHALHYFIEQGLTKMTIGSCALEEYKKIIGPKNFKRWFPKSSSYYHDVKQSYRGGFTWLNPKFAGKVIFNGVVLDINSLYPFVMKNELLPYGTPIFYKGKYQEDEYYPLYIQQIKCSFELKEGKIPTIQAKKGMHFKANEYLTSSEDEEIVLTLTSVDLELFRENYEIYNPQYIGGYKFKASVGMFDEYIDKWTKVKILAKETGNWGMYLIAKLYLNSLYGKFGTSTEARKKVPYIDDKGVVRFYDSEPEEKEGVYVPMAAFITSYGRLKTISAAQKITDDYNAGKSNIQFVYADTDSLHLISPDFELPEGLDIDPVNLGAWDYEAAFTKGKFLRSKCYIENHIISEEEYIEGKKSDTPNMYTKYKGKYNVLKVTVSGMPAVCHKDVTFNNFEIGATYEGKVQPKIVEGGTVLVDVDFTIKKV